MDGLEVFLTVTEYSESDKHIQYLVQWGDFELQRIDITAQKGTTQESTKVFWTERNAGMHENGVFLVSQFIEGGHMIEVVERYARGIEEYLKNPMDRG